MKRRKFLVMIVAAIGALLRGSIGEACSLGQGFQQGGSGTVWLKKNHGPSCPCKRAERESWRSKLRVYDPKQPISKYLRNKLWIERDYDDLWDDE